MKQRRAHVKILDANKLERAEQARAARDVEMMAKAKQMMQGKATARKGAESAPAEASGAHYVCSRSCYVLGACFRLNELLRQRLQLSLLRAKVLFT